MIDLVLFVLPNARLSDPMMYFPLGVLYLAAVARRAGFDVRIVDFRMGVDEEAIPESEFYGFSATTPEIVVAKKLAQRIKGHTIIGGAHATLLPEDCVKDFNWVVRGEGENILPGILAGLQPQGVHIAPRLNLDNLPLPAWDLAEHPFSETLFPGERYGKSELAATIIGSRGCPFSCHFCANPLRPPVVYRSADNILTEVATLKSMGVNHFRFEDDNITLLPDFERLCLLMKEMKVHWKAHTRSDQLTQSKAQLLRLGGCEECGIGVESADDRVLRINNKKETVSDHIKAVKMLKDAGVRVKTYFISGLPGETDETLNRNMEFISKVQPEKWTVSTFIPYPGCAIYQRPGAFGIRIVDRDFTNWWNFAPHFVHELNGQTRKQMWQRYTWFYEWLRSDIWRT